MAAAISDNTTLELLELDRDLASRLSLQFAARENINVQQVDALDFDFIALGQQINQQSDPPSNKPLRVFGNLPYNISTPLIFHLLEQAHNLKAETKPSPLNPPAISDMHFMLQREVVDRMAAPPGNKTYGRLSIMTQYYCQVEPLFDVPPEAFDPKPKVMSAIVRLLPYKTLPIVANQPAMLDKIVKAAFTQRRKTLRNGLKAYIDAEALEALGINPAVRAETLDLNSFVNIANALGDLAS